MKRLKKTAALIVFTLFVNSCIAGEVLAQNSSTPAVMNGASQYYLGDKDQVLMNVNVWGYVQRPGQYMIPINTDLVSLISFAGGPRDGANLTKVMIIRGGHGSEMASTNPDIEKGSTVPILNVNVTDYLKKGEISKIPLLNANDTVLIPQSSGNKVSSFFGIKSLFGSITAMASIALIIDRLSRRN